MFLFRTWLVKFKYIFIVTNQIIIIITNNRGKINMKTTFKSFLTIFLISMIFTGCGGAGKHLVMGTIDKNNKTVTINGVNDEIFDIKYALVKDGWNIKIDNQMKNSTGTITKNIDINTKTIYDTKYRMYVFISHWPRFDKPIASYNISLVENTTNQEILSIAQKRKLFVEHNSESIAEELISALRKIEQ